MKEAKEWLGRDRLAQEVVADLARLTIAVVTAFRRGAELLPFVVEIGGDNSAPRFERLPERCGLFSRPSHFALNVE